MTDGLHSDDGGNVLGWVQLTNRCNLKCSYCYTESGPKAGGGELTLEEAESVLIDLQKSGARIVMLSGGEPTIYPHIEKLIEFACGELGLKITLVSNGTHLTPAVLSALQQHGCTVQVSLDAVDPKVYRGVRGNNLLSKALDGIELLREHDISLTLSATLTNTNKRYVGDIVRYALERDIQFVHLAPTHWKDGSPFQRNLFIEDLYPTLHELYELQKDNYLYICIDLIENLVLPVALGIRRQHYCNAMAGRTVEVASDGNAYFCAAQRDIPEMRIGSIKEGHSLFDLVAFARADGRFPNLGSDTIEECRSCDYRYICAGGCRAMTWHQTGGLHHKHPNCHDLKRFIARIKDDLASGDIADYAEFLRVRTEAKRGEDALLKYF
jgi:radical SAM protein with 4Fe4S-binding SPASM domain